MADLQPSKSESKISTDQIIASIKEVRDSLIISLLSEEHLVPFAEEHFGTIALSPIKLEFIKRDLSELRKTYLDLAYYAALIRENRAEIPLNHPLIISEIYTIFKKYGIAPAK